MVEGAKLIHDELFGPGKEGFKSRDDAKEEEGGRRFSKGFPSHGLLVMQDSASPAPQSTFQNNLPAAQVHF